MLLCAVEPKNENKKGHGLRQSVLFEICVNSSLTYFLKLLCIASCVFWLECCFLVLCAACTVLVLSWTCVYDLWGRFLSSLVWGGMLHVAHCGVHCCSSWVLLICKLYLVWGGIARYPCTLLVTNTPWIQICVCILAPCQHPAHVHTPILSATLVVEII